MKRAVIGLLAWAVMSTAATAQTVGTCSPGLAEAYLDVGNVRARVLNDGSLFYRGEPHVYNVPKGSRSNAIFYASFWIGGMVGGTLRMAAGRYGPAEFWPGPLDDDGNPPEDCAPYDRIYTISKADVEAFEATGITSHDLADWPTGLGAPTVDASRAEIDLSAEPLAARKDRRIDLSAGERPSFLGDQMAWWIMNDLGNEHRDSEAEPIGVEVHGLAFAFDAPGHVGNATFYRYTVVYRGVEPLEEAHIALYMDPDLGFFGDDWVGSDSLLGIGYVWNADNSDIVFGSNPDESYGTPPPALGVDFFQGPIVASLGAVARVGNRSIPGFRNLSLSSFMDYWEGDFAAPGKAADYYNFMQGRWRDGKAVTVGGNGRDFSAIPTRFMYSGDASRCAYWTECNADGAGRWHGPGDRRFVATTGPVTMAPGSRQEILIGLVYGRGTDHFDSVTEMKAADLALQRFVDSWFTEWPPVPAAPTGVPELVSPADGVIARAPSVTLQRGCTEDALYCETQVDDDPGFGSPVFYSHQGTFAAPVEPQRSYWWRSRGVGRAEVPGPWSAVRSFTTGGEVFEQPIRDFQTVANAAGPIHPPECGALAMNESGFPNAACAADRPSANQQATTDLVWAIHAGNASIPFGPATDKSTYLGRSWGSREATGSVGVLLPYDYEWRFTAAGGKAKRAYDGGDVMDVPFELWRTGIGTPNDPSDDVRLVPVVCEQTCRAGTAPNRFDIGGDHSISGGTNDPTTDWVDWLLPDDTSPGQVGYEAFFAGTGGAREIMARQVLVCFNCGSAAPYPAEYPEIGTVFRIVTGRPPVPALLAPANGAAVPADGIRLFWQDAPELRSGLQVSSDPSFVSPDVALLDVQTNDESVVLTPGTWWWRVGSETLGWSEAWSLHVLPATAVEAGGELPTSFALDAIWPNPFNPLATIRFGLPADAVATVDVVDVIGRRVAVLEAGGRRAAGWHSVQFDGSRLASGVYFVRLVAGGRLDVKSVVLLK